MRFGFHFHEASLPIDDDRGLLACITIDALLTPHCRDFRAISKAATLRVSYIVVSYAADGGFRFLFISKIFLTFLSTAVTRHRHYIFGFLQARFFRHYGFCFAHLILRDMIWDFDAYASCYVSSAAFAVFDLPMPNGAMRIRWLFQLFRYAVRKFIDFFFSSSFPGAPRCFSFSSSCHEPGLRRWGRFQASSLSHTFYHDTFERFQFITPLTLPLVEAYLPRFTYLAVFISTDFLRFHWLIYEVISWAKAIFISISDARRSFHFWKLISFTPRTYFSAQHTTISASILRLDDTWNAYFDSNTGRWRVALSCDIPAVTIFSGCSERVAAAFHDCGSAAHFPEIFRARFDVTLACLVYLPRYNISLSFSLDATFLICCCHDFDFGPALMPGMSHDGRYRLWRGGRSIASRIKIFAAYYRFHDMIRSFYRRRFHLYVIGDFAWPLELLSAYAI